MSQIGIFYGSTTGTTEEVARRIGDKLGVAASDIHEASSLNAECITRYEVLLLGSSTWGAGELQDDWYDALKTLKAQDLGNKFVALFGCGDSDSYPDTFCDAIGIIYEELKESGCTFCGMTDPSGYTFDESIAVVNGKFAGLPLDEDNESSQTEARIDKWIAQLRTECIH
ncbi:MAG: flavodoxin FldA [Bacteroides sp.]|nr:flavodoxin FldA [Bacteroides sp.]